MKKIVAIDLDGTLLHSDCTISSYSKEVIAEAVKNGIMVVPTSGRSFRSIKNQVQDIEGVKYDFYRFFFIQQKSTIPRSKSQKRYFVMRLQGLEPWTRGLRVRCSTN